MFPREAAGDCRQAVSAHLVWVDLEKVKSRHEVLEVQQGAAFFFLAIEWRACCAAGRQQWPQHGPRGSLAFQLPN